MKNYTLIGTLGNRCKHTPMIVGLSFALCSSLPSFAYADDAMRHVEAIQLSQQIKKISGVVVDEIGEPLIGVSVLVKGTSNGTITNLDGQFSIDLSGGQKELVISYIGYKNQTIVVGSHTQLTVKLEPDTKTLDEVVVVGYGTVKKRDLTGAVVSVKSDDITMNPGSNPLQALQGKVAGLDITKTSGQAGAGVTMQLRGTRSFTASGNPTCIIDGMPGDFSTLNPNDIESIEVLKDASSTAVYGSAGANGVIIITTKSAKEGKINVSFNAYAGFNGWAKTPTMRSGESYIQGLRDANIATGNWNSSADDERIINGLGAGAYDLYLQGKYIDWADELMQNSMTQNYSVSVAGGTEKTKAYFSLNFSDENGQYTGDNYKVYSTNMRIDHKITNWLKAGVNMQASYVHQNKAYAKLDKALTSCPLGEIYDENGKMNVDPVAGGGMVNLLLNTQPNTYKDQGQNFKIYFNPYIELNPLKGLSIISRIGASLNYNRKNYFQGQGSYQYYIAGGTNVTGVNQNVFASITQNRGYNYKWENVVTYNFKIKNDHDFTLTGVTTWNHDQSDNTFQKQDNIVDNKLLWHGMNSKSGDVTSSYDMSKGLGLIGRLNYSYLGRYLFSASVRYDGSSRLAKDTRWNTFPAASVAWRISDESFMEETKNWLDNLKLRVGYGVTGTANIDPYSSVSRLETGFTSIGGVQETIYNFSQNYANPNLGWEKSYNTNIGVDMAFLNNRIDFTADYYITKTEGVIWKKELPVVNGAYNASSLYYTNMNLCSTKNSGIELALKTRNIETKDFTWNSALTFSYNKEKILSLMDGTSDNIKNSGSDYTLSKGYAINSYYQYKVLGIWQTNEAADAAVFGAKPGDIKIDIPGMNKEVDGKWYKTETDANGNEVKKYYTADSVYSPGEKDYQVIGHNSPDFTLGFQNTFTYKSFDLSVYAYMRWGQMIKYDMLASYDPTGKGNFPEYFNYWTESNPSNDFPAINANREINDYTGYYALNYVDGSFFKIKNITLGYTLPGKIAKKAGIDRFRVYATMTNPFVFAKSHLLKEYDPEMNGSLNYPLTKQLVFGVNLSF